MMKRKGFTLVELLVVIAIIALLMGILMPALARVRQIAYRMICGTNIAGIGKAMLMYANDNEGLYQHSGGPGAMWTDEHKIYAFADEDGEHYGLPPFCRVTVTSALYLLIRYADLTPKQFVCKGDIGTKVFKLPATVASTTITDVTDVWDFGDTIESDLIPGQYNTYAYHMPFAEDTTGSKPGFPMTSTSRPESPLIADRNPYLDNNARAYIDGLEDDEDPPTWVPQAGEIPNLIPAHYSDADWSGNSACHQREGQNVLFNDGHVKFSKYPNVGIANDNIWKYWDTEPPPDPDPEGRELGEVPYTGLPDDGCKGCAPQSPVDAFLVSEKNWR
jgi:prepilin-type N-terminal cleavage/methylation domain-containing protein/prepilin-type processing-associated H-X9-DG protein